MKPKWPICSHWKFWMKYHISDTAVSQYYDTRDENDDIASIFLFPERALKYWWVDFDKVHFIVEFQS